jgi:hypothetical protein
MDPRIWIRIHTKLAWIRNIGGSATFFDGGADPTLTFYFFYADQDQV